MHSFSKIGTLLAAIALLGGAMPVQAAMSVHAGTHWGVLLQSSTNVLTQSYSNSDLYGQSSSSSSSSASSHRRGSSSSSSSIANIRTYGMFQGGLLKEWMAFSRWLIQQYNLVYRSITQLSADARTRLYTDLLTSIHSSFAQMRTNIASILSAEVTGYSSSSSSSSSSNSSSSSMMSSSSSSSSSPASSSMSSSSSSSSSSLASESSSSSSSSSV